MRALRATFLRALSALALVASIVIAPSLAHAVVYPCTQAGLDSALAAGGVATFSCAAPTTIAVSATKTIAVSGTDLDGGGRLILSGSDARPVLSVAAGVTATVRGMVLERGSATGYGGCLQVAGTLTLNDSTVRRCVATSGGNGAVVWPGGTLHANRSTFTANDGSVEGTIAVHGTAFLTNVTLADTGHRGVVARFGGTATLTHCTIATRTGEPAFAILPGDTITASHTLFIASPGTPAVAGSGTYASQGYNVYTSAPALPVGGPATGDQSGVSPLLGPLADNGGLTQTRALLACSPGINAGATTGGPATDQRGMPRIQGGARDVGAYESSSLPCLTIDDAAANEGNAATTPIAMTVRLSGVSTLATTVSYASANGTATIADVDYSALSGTLTFPAGTTTRTVTLQARGDTRFEVDETAHVDLSAPGSASIADARGTVTIRNDDARPAVSVADVSLAELDTGMRAMTFTVTLGAATSETVTVAYATVNGTATAGSDYVVASGTLTFTPGATSRTVAVTIRGDVTFEPHETFELVLGPITNATAGDLRAVGTITNDDAMPALSVADAVITEGDAGTTTATFTVTLSAPSASAITAAYATIDGTATTADADYVAASGTLTIPAGSRTGTVTVMVRGDVRFEPDETFVLRLSTPSGATLADRDGTGRIANDDARPTVSVADVSLDELHTGMRAASFAVTLAGATSETVTVGYATANATATAGSDYVAASGMLTFAPGTTTRTVDVTIRGDATFEPDETFELVLGPIMNAAAGDVRAVGTIVNDDAMPTLAVADVTVAEGDSGTTTATFTVTLAGTSATAVTATYATVDGTATIADADYAAASGTLTIPAGATGGTVAVTVTSDARFEADETLVLRLSAPSGATISDGEGTGTITNDDAPPAVTIADLSVAEDGGDASISVRLGAPSGLPVTVGYATADGTAMAGGDYVAASGTLTFAPGATALDVAVAIVGDAIAEPDETFLVRLSGASGADLADDEATVTIMDDEGDPTVSVAGTSVAEGDGEDVEIVFTVTLSHASAQVITVAYATEDGTATIDDGDYAPAEGTLTLAPGETSATIAVPVLGDTELEPDETIVVTLSAPTNATLAVATAEGTVTNDDEPRLDGGALRDAGIEDGGVAVDGGGPDAGSAAVDGGGCGCAVIGADRRAASPLAAAMMLGLALVLALRRRRRD